MNQYQQVDVRLQNQVDVDNQVEVVLNQNFDTSNIVRALEATRYAYAQTGQLIGQRLYEIANVLAAPTWTTSQTRGKSWGGAQTTTHTEYEEHTVTNGEAFSSEESWGTATAVDSSHAADLWFTYKVRNIGTEYAREIANLAFNIYIGDDPNPVYTYFVGPDLGGDSKFHNFMPAEEHTYTARRIPLTLNQMAAIDLGGPVRIVVEDFTYGIDELFYEDAANAGVLVAIEDGTDDGDEAIDTYLIPTWGEETVLDVLARYFPHTTDADGTLIAVWTPEERSDTPAWCNEPRRVGTTLWCRHALSTADWWNVYTNGLGDGSEGFQDTPAAPGSVALFRFNKDSDLDGYSDRSERRLGTDPSDPASYPRPELIAGVHSLRSGNAVTATLSLLNTGLYDAYGVEAVMIAPDDSVSITNNTVGGSGRVRAQKQVIVGSRIVLQSPLPDAWRQAGHATPAAGGYYTGQQDRTYTFTVQCANPAGCDVGASTWSLAWNDDAGAGGTLNVGAGYASPTFLAAGALGVKVALYTGRVSNGDSFTVEARTPRDTFQYTINREPYTEPVVIVSYNDPQGNHRFITPVRLGTPADDLAPHSGQMLQDPGVEIVTTGPVGATAAQGLGLKSQADSQSLLKQAAPQPVSTGLSYQPDNSLSGLTAANTLNLVVNNPTGVTLTDAHLFLEFVNISGTVASEVPVTVTLPPGPTVQPVTFNLSTFNPPYTPDEDYIVMAFLTDYQGNILDTAARPLSSFQEDPRPAFAMAAADATWDFGTAAQGTLLKRSFSVANTGHLDLLTYVGAPPGVSLSQTGSRRLGPADLTTYEIALDTAALPVGAYDQTITLRTSDPDQPSRSITIHGEVTPMPEDSPGGATLRPLDWDATIPGNHSQGEWVEFTHTLAPEPQSLHPVKVYSQDYSALKGVGKYAAPFGQGTASADMFGDGGDGDLVVPPGPAVTINTARASVLASGASAAPSNSTGFSVGDLVLFHQTQRTGNVGRWELNTIAAINGPNDWTLTHTLQYVYDNVNGRAQVIKVPQYRNMTVPSGATLTAPTWDGTTGGILAFLANGTLDISGTISAKGNDGTTGPTPGIGIGFSGGTGIVAYGSTAHAGEGTSGPAVIQQAANGTGGGGAVSTGTYQSGGNGGGGGHATAGGAGTSSPVGGSGGAGGGLSGTADLAVMTFGGGGGGSSGANLGATGGGAGGGIIFLAGTTITMGPAGSITANGGAGGQSASAGGSGAGGSILIKTQTATLGSSQLTAIGAPATPGTAVGGAFVGGAGGAGRIRIEYCETLSGSTNPPASTQKLNCYIAEQVESAPYDRTRLNLPESFTGGRTYKVQYGRRLVYSAAGEQVTTLRVPAAAFTNATLDALISEVGSGSLSFKLDVGNDGTWDWQWSGNVSNATTLNSPGLAAAFSAYWAGHGAPTSGSVDVPVKVSLSKGGQVLLTNLQMTPGGSTVRFVRLPARPYSTLTLDLTVGESGSGPLTLAADVGDDGTVDWTWSGTPAYPLRLTTANLATAVTPTSPAAAARWTCPSASTWPPSSPWP